MVMKCLRGFWPICIHPSAKQSHMRFWKRLFGSNHGNGALGEGSHFSLNERRPIRDISAGLFVDILRRGGVTEWNNYRATSVAQLDLNLEHADLSAAGVPKDLSGIDLSRSNLAHALFPVGTTVAGGKLMGCDLRMLAPEIDFSKADLRGADFASTQLHKCRFVGADLRDANFAFAVLSTAVPTGQLPDGRWKYELQCADFTHARIDRLLLLGATVSTDVEYHPRALESPEMFVRSARQAGMKIDGMTGEPCFGPGWNGIFMRYSPR